MKNINKVLSVLFLMAISLVYGQEGLPEPVDPGGGQGTGGTGAQSIPVDMYVYVLAVVAVMLLVFFAKKYKSQKI
ncbi:hypothetical protein [Chryseobacterium sp. Leaf394]|uniref:hypothetical protein n=1 Tax=Chryseobacterium sp. Leaf394 TaxID=1736361 RepID=UPI0006F849B5|nr:hypothetical protein [Chryseobacterium sp. Leaf394]KQS93708.1 signal peptidase [Chryseobacterium sp. Leaf394]